MIKVFRISRNTGKGNSSVGAKDARPKMNEIKLKDVNDKDSSSNGDGLGFRRGFKLCKVPTCPTEADEHELPRTRSGSSGKSNEKDSAELK